MAILALFAGQTTGLSELLETDECEEPCPGDSPDGRCPPACQSCVCCATSRPAVVSPGAAILAPQANRSELGEPTDTPSSPEPREILHVPKPFLA